MTPEHQALAAMGPAELIAKEIGGGAVMQWREAVLAERERCAQIAERSADAAETHDAKLAAKYIAECIRTTNS